MSVNAFLEEILPRLDAMLETFKNGDDKDSLLAFEKSLSIRSSMALDLIKSPDKMQLGVNQLAYDTASGLERQINIIGNTRSEYFRAEKGNRQNISKAYSNLRNTGVSMKNAIPVNADASADNGYTEPYIDASGNIVWSES